MTTNNSTKNNGSTKKKSNNDKWYRSWLAKQIYIVVGAVIVTLFILFSLLKLITRHNEELSVPSFASMTLEEAASVAEKVNLRLEVTDSVYIPGMALGAVFRQNPEADGKVKKNRRILLTINAKTPKKVKMPSLVGYSLRQAQSELTASQLKVGKLIYVEDIATNNVISQLYNGAQISSGKLVPSGSQIDLKLGVNAGEGGTHVPNLKSISYQLVKEYLTDNSLNIGRAIFDNTVKNYSDSLEAFVYKQAPAASNNVTVPMGTTVTIYLSKDKNLLKKESEENTQVEEE
ncbi:MAG: PASTA domain-containing protein [Bacteroidales bacterium]